MTEEHRRNILWADDEIELLRPHIKFLEQKGFSVTAVPNGEDALTELGRGRYDLVLLDEMMPGLGGLETLDQIQSRDLGVPVILVTKSEEETLMDQAIGRAITDYLIKPVNPSQVFLACKRVFDSQKLQDSQRARDYVGEMQRWQSLDLRGLDWPAWAELAADVARWDVRFDQVPEAGLKQAHQDFRRGLNIDFGRFIEDHYPHWAPGPGSASPTWARSSGVRRLRATSTSTRESFPRSRSTGIPSGRSPTRCGKPASTCRWGRSVWSGRLSRARSSRASSAGCRSSPTGPRPARRTRRS